MSAKVVLGLHGEKNQIPSPYARRKGLKKRQLSLIVLNQFCERKARPNFNNESCRQIPNHALYELVALSAPQ